ncbi:MAG: sulfatase family protein [Planctomycetota bacterium]
MAAAPPNIVMILADDMGYGDVACLNPDPDPKIPTPHMDRMAAEGLTFTDAHASAAVCTPSRYSILTGRYAWRGRLQRNVLGPGYPPLVEADLPTLGGMLGDAGYHCGCIGKWHLGMDWPFRTPRDLDNTDWWSDEIREALADIDWTGRVGGGPVDRGFDSYFGVDIPNFPPYCWIEDDHVVDPPTGMKPDAMFGISGPMVDGWRYEDLLPTQQRRAVETIERRAAEGRPFFLYLSLTAPHTPIAPTAEFRGRSGAGAYGDFVAQVDHVVGEVLAALDRTGIADNTLVIATSDNGSPGRSGSAEAPGTVIETCGHNPSGPLRGLKGDAWDGGHRIPCIARWPAETPAGATCDHLVCLMDLFATAADLLDRERPTTACDSVSVLPYLTGEATATPVRESLVHHSQYGHFAIRRGPWKLIESVGSGGWFSPDPPVTCFDPPGQLYHMDEDLRERRNRYDDCPDIVDDLRHLLTDTRCSASR